MSDSFHSSRPEPFSTRLGELGSVALSALHGLEIAQRRAEPETLPSLVRQAAELAERLDRALVALRELTPPDGLAALRDELGDAADRAGQALVRLSEAESGGAPAVIESFRLHCRAQEAFYPLRSVFPPLGRYFAEPAWHERLPELDPPRQGEPSVGLHRAGGARDARGGFSLYVPERTDGSRALPLVVALHGGFGHGADFVWTWLREARSREFLLLSPTSRDTTWSLAAPELDARPLRSMIEWVSERWPVDRGRVLLTGLSDGATFALLTGLGEDSPFTALAPVAGVLHPMNFAAGNLTRAAGRRIYLVHGARDWMFPISLAHMARDALLEAGAELVFREIEDLAHAYPREENDRILAWFDPALTATEEAD